MNSPIKISIASLKRTSHVCLILSLALFIFSANLIFADDLVRVFYNQNPTNLGIVLNSGFRTILHRPGISIDVVVPANQRQWTESLSDTRSLHKNFDRYIRTISSQKNYGSYHTDKEIERQLDEWESKYPQLVQKSIIGYGWKGSGRSGHNPIHLLTIGNPKRTTPGLLLFGGIHSRELSSTEVLLRVTERLLSEAAEKEAGLKFFEKITLYIIPCLNPDGRNLVFNGNIWWRKNCRPGKNNQITGVDLNRNFPAHFGNNHPYGGSNGAPVSETYRGPSPFSEPESRALRDLVLSHQDIVASISFHAYGGFILVPNGYNGKWPPEHVELFKEIVNSLSPDKKWPSGTVKELLGYYSNGRHDDWLYGNHSGKKESILPIQLEIGDSFYPEAHKLAPMTDEVYPVIKRLASRISIEPEVKLTYICKGKTKRAKITVKNQRLDSINNVRGRVYIDGQYLGSFHEHNLGGLLRSPETANVTRTFPCEELSPELKHSCQVTLRWGKESRKYFLPLTTDKNAQKTCVE